MKNVLFSFMLLSVLPVIAQDSIMELPVKKVRAIKSTRFTTLMESRNAYQFDGDKFQKAEFLVKPELEIPFTKNFRFKALGRVYAEFLDNLEPKEPNQEEVSEYSKRFIAGDLFEAELREFYFDWKIKKHYLTVGKQQIVWGKADGLKILDVVNPTNMREFLLDDFDNSRIPLWSVKTDLNLKIAKLQLLWIPDQTYHDIPGAKAAFFPIAFFPAPPEGLRIVQTPLVKPDRVIEDADAGARLSAFIKGWDVTLNYLYAYDDFPVAQVNVNSDSTGPYLIITPLYKRYHLTGGTFTNSFGKFAVRGEVGVFLDKTFSSSDPAARDGLFKSNQVMGVLGFDYSGISNSLISFQVFEDHVFSDTEIMGRSQSETYASLLLNRNFKNETITAEVIGVQNINRGDGFVRPRVKYQVLSNLNLALGGDVFYGDEKGLFGQFVKRTRVTFNIQWGL
jgi:hypothetical protein